MSGVWGRNIKLSIFGESHGPAIGIVLDGLPPGFEIDWDEVRREMDRRAPGRGDISTPRRERDEWELLSGLFKGKTTGAPLCAVIRNENTKSGDYSPNLLRPGHADYTALLKYGGHADYRGGGHFSGRLTAPLLLAGAVAKQLLKKAGIEIGARIARIYDVPDADMPIESITDVSNKPFPVYDDGAGERMREAVLKAKGEGDSLGGVIECAALGLPPGLGDPFFDSLESVISSMMFSIPAVKGIEFGGGFGLSEMTGYEANDRMYMDNGEIRFKSNNNGGINGGISNGRPLVFRVAVKPTPTIGREQETVDVQRRESVKISFGGRHDPCIVPRAVPVVEAGLALCLLDCFLTNRDVEDAVPYSLYAAGFSRYLRVGFRFSASFSSSTINIGIRHSTVTMSH